jgi:hypothetical protein
MGLVGTLLWRALTPSLQMYMCALMWCGSNSVWQAVNFGAGCGVMCGAVKTAGGGMSLLAQAAFVSLLRLHACACVGAWAAWILRAAN